MSTTKGQKRLASGNVFRWKHENAGGRGVISGEFSAEPTKADIEEAQAYSRTLAPIDSRKVMEGVANRFQHQQVRDAFLTPGVSRN